MTVSERRRPVAPPAVRVVAVAAALAVVVGTLLPWTTTFDPATGFDDHPVWTSGAGPVVGAAGEVVGVALLAVVSWAGRSRRAARWAPAAAAVAVAGTAGLLVDGYGAPAQFFLTPYGFTDRRTGTFRSLVEALPPAEVWLLAGVLAALAVTLVVLISVRESAAGDAETDPRPRRVPVAVGVAGLVGVVLVVLGASVLPWDITSSARTPVLWRTDVENALGAALLVVSGVVVFAATVRSAGRAVFALASAAAAIGTGVVLPSRLPVPWADQAHGLSSVRTRDDSFVALPARWHFDLATGSVLVGALVVLVAAAVAVWRAPALPARGGHFVPAASSGRSCM